LLGSVENQANHVPAALVRQVQGSTNQGWVEVLVFTSGTTVTKHVPGLRVGEVPSEESRQLILIVTIGKIGTIEAEDPIERAGATVPDLQEEGPIGLRQPHRVLRFEWP
jgi:hypothetical protein